MPPIQITGLRPPPYFTTVLTMPTPLGDGSYLLGVLYGTSQPATINAVAVCGILDKDGTFTEVGASDQTRKAAGITVWREGRDAHMIASQEAQPKSGGSTSVPFLYSFPDTLPLPLPVIDQPARTQALAATNMGHNLDQRLKLLEAGGGDAALVAVRGLAAALAQAVEPYTK